jgi:hypothetical protein
MVFRPLRCNQLVPLEHGPDSRHRLLAICLMVAHLRQVTRSGYCSLGTISILLSNVGASSRAYSSPISSSVACDGREEQCTPKPPLPRLHHCTSNMTNIDTMSCEQPHIRVSTVQAMQHKSAILSYPISVLPQERIRKVSSPPARPVSFPRAAGSVSVASPLAACQSFHDF